MFSKLRRWWRQWLPGEAVEAETEEELLFHLGGLVEDNLQRQLPFDQAWQQALNRFGSLRSYAGECGRVRTSRRLMLRRIAYVGLIAIGVLMAWLSMTVYGVWSKGTSWRFPIAGRIVDQRQQPVAGANVLVVLKTWPGGRYRQESFAAVTDVEGTFRLPRLVPSEDRCAVQVAAIKDGYGFASRYLTTDEIDRGSFGAIALNLSSVSPAALYLQDAKGQPIVNAEVAPASRRTIDGQTHMVYFQGSESIRVTSDAQGRIPIRCFQAGDEAELFVRLPDREWRQQQVRIEPEQTVVRLESAF